MSVEEPPAGERSVQRAGCLGPVNRPHGGCRREVQVSLGESVDGVDHGAMIERLKEESEMLKGIRNFRGDPPGG